MRPRNKVQHQSRQGERARIVKTTLIKRVGHKRNAIDSVVIRPASDGITDKEGCDAKDATDAPAPSPQARPGWLQLRRSRSVLPPGPKRQAQQNETEDRERKNQASA